MELSIIFSGVVAFSTVIYAILTWKLVSETKKLRQYHITPDVSIYLEKSQTNTPLIYFYIENIGNGVAKNVRIEILKDFNYYDSELQKIKNHGTIKNGISNFYPHQKYRYYYTHTNTNFKEKKEDYIHLRVKYDDILKNKHEKDYILSIGELANLTMENPPDSYIGMVAYELKEIKNILKKSK